MKKFLLIAMVFVLSGCKSTIDITDVENEIREYYTNLETIEYIAEVTTSTFDKSIDFEVSYIYNDDLSDYAKILAPESVAGIEVEILKETEGLRIALSDLQLETLLSENIGVNPSDFFSFAIRDLKESIPSSISLGENTITLFYDQENITKQINLNSSDYTIQSIECFIDHERVILGSFSKQGE